MQIEYSLLDSKTLSAGFTKYFSITDNFETSILQGKTLQYLEDSSWKNIYMNFTASPYF